MKHLVNIHKDNLLFLMLYYPLHIRRHVVVGLPRSSLGQITRHKDQYATLDLIVDA